MTICKESRSRLSRAFNEASSNPPGRRIATARLSAATIRRPIVAVLVVRPATAIQGPPYADARITIISFCTAFTPGTAPITRSASRR